MIVDIQNRRDIHLGDGTVSVSISLNNGYGLIFSPCTQSNVGEINNTPAESVLDKNVALWFEGRDAIKSLDVVIDLLKKIRITIAKEEQPELYCDKFTRGLETLLRDTNNRWNPNTPKDGAKKFFAVKVKDLCDGDEFYQQLKKAKEIVKSYIENNIQGSYEYCLDQIDVITDVYTDEALIRGLVYAKEVEENVES